MNKYIVFLRAVNVSGKNLIKMSALKDKIHNAGYSGVQTYIQSGNIILISNKSATEVKAEIKAIIKTGFDLDIEVFVIEENELKKSISQNPFPNDLPGNKVFITFLNEKPTVEQIAEFKKLKLEPEKYLIISNLFYFYLPEGMSVSKLNNNFIEKKLKVKGTGRNINTINKMLNLISK